jgi:hypothetical protein
MNKQISIPGFITAKPAEAYESDYYPNVKEGLSFRFTPYEPSAQPDGYVLVCKYTLAFEIPAGWDPRPGQIASLEAKKAELTREFSAAVVQINRQIAQLQAICYDSEAA